MASPSLTRQSPRLPNPLTAKLSLSAERLHLSNVRGLASSCRRQDFFGLLKLATTNGARLISVVGQRLFCICSRTAFIAPVSGAKYMAGAALAALENSAEKALVKFFSLGNMFNLFIVSAVATVGLC